MRHDNVSLFSCNRVGHNYRGAFPSHKNTKRKNLIHGFFRFLYKFS